MLGIVATVFALMGWIGIFGLISGLIGMICGIVGLVQARKALSAGRMGVMRSFGFWLSFIGMLACIILVVWTVVVLVTGIMYLQNMYDASNAASDAMNSALQNELDALNNFK